MTSIPEDKASKFLKELMGDNKYKELKDNGKIEIKSGKFIYELHSNGNIVNKTLNQKYCVIPSKDSISYPPSDILAIKWMYLNYNHDLVEKVANRTDLNRVHDGLRNVGREETGSATYNDFIDYMEHMNWYINRVRIDELSTNYITTYDVQYNENRSVNVNAPSGGQISVMGTPCKHILLDIRCPAGQQMTTKGTSQVDIRHGDDLRSAHRFNLNIRDNEGKEIDKMTNIIIERASISGLYTRLWSGHYGMLNLTREIETEIDGEELGYILKSDSELFRWERGIMLNGEDILRISIIPTCNINSKDVKILMDVDIWRQT